MAAQSHDAGMKTTCDRSISRSSSNRAMDTHDNEGSSEFDIDHDSSVPSISSSVDKGKARAVANETVESSLRRGRGVSLSLSSTGHAYGTAKFIGHPELVQENTSHTPMNTSASSSDAIDYKAPMPFSPLRDSPTLTSGGATAQHGLAESSVAGSAIGVFHASPGHITKLIKIRSGQPSSSNAVGSSSGSSSSLVSNESQIISAGLTSKRPGFSKRLQSSVDTLNTQAPSVAGGVLRNNDPALVLRISAQVTENERGTSDIFRGCETEQTAGSDRASRNLHEYDSDGSKCVVKSSTDADSCSTAPARSRSQSAPLIRMNLVSPASISLPRASILAFSPNPGFVTALSTPISEGIFDLVEGEHKSDPFECLPFEIKVNILRTLVESCEDEHRRELSCGTWTGARARERWVGEADGRRELIKCARVSHSFKTLAYDGQIWKKIDVAVLGPDVFASPGLLRLAEQAGSFVNTLELTGMAQMTGYTLVEASRLLGDPRTGETNLTKLDLSGCRSVTSTSLVFLLNSSPHLIDVNFFALACVQNNTLAQLGGRLEMLNVSRCPNLTASGLSLLASTHLRSLRIARLSEMNDETVGDLFTKHTALKTLDLSSTPGISDAAFDIDDRSSTLRALQNLYLSSCCRLTDRVFEHLANRVPDLRVLELAHNRNFGQSSALDELLLSTPNLEKMDLEGCHSVTDRALACLTDVGLLLKLEWLVLSGCSALTEPYLAGVVRERLGRALNVIEVDSTNINEDTVKNFIFARHQGLLSSAEQKTGIPLHKCEVKVSCLDARFLTRRLQRDFAPGQLIRTRQGQRGYAFRDFRYLDERDAKSAAQRECDADSRVVLRTFHSHIAVDAAQLAVAAKKDKDAAKLSRGRRRGRAWSDYRRPSSGDDDENASQGCIVF